MIETSDVVNETIKAYQPQGLYGERDIHRRPFEACPIQKFDPGNKEHVRLVELGAECRQIMHKMSSHIMVARLGMARLASKKLIFDQLTEIDNIVKALFKREGLSLTAAHSKAKWKNNPSLFDL